MKKTVIIFCLHFLPFAFIYSQTEVDSDCNSRIENIFKVHNLKIRHEAVQHIYEKHRFLYIMSEDGWNHLFGLIRAYSFFEEQKDSVPDLNSEKHEFPKNHSDFEKMKAKTVPAKLLSEEEMNRYIEQLNCTPKQALHEYSAFIRNIKSQKEIYLKCIDAELVKGDSSEYANTDMRLYGFLAPGWSLTPPPSQLSKLDYLKVFKEFILIDNEEILPESMRLIAYLKCNCKIP